MAKYLQQSGIDEATGEPVDVKQAIVQFPDGREGGLVAAVAKGMPGTPEHWRIPFNAASDLPVDITSVAPSEVTQIVPSTGKKIAIITFHSDVGMVPFATGVNVSLNANDTTVAADRLSIPDVAKGAALTASNSKDAAMATSEYGLMFDLLGEAEDIQKIHLVGVPTGGTGAASICYAEVTVL